MKIHNILFPVLYKEVESSWSVGAYRNCEEFLSSSQGDTKFYQNLIIYSSDGLKYRVSKVVRKSRRFNFFSLIMIGAVDVEVEETGSLAIHEFKKIVDAAINSNPDFWDAGGQLYTMNQMLEAALTIENVIELFFEK